ncbi:MAG: putative potassium transport system protein kup [candidate division TM6 bacterium GW2011_GWF2_38_10]|nr:MAG: putative potassium transport system protein kup [candidate division TM6 bacterium GW2011_GWF2_38_10]
MATSTHTQGRLSGVVKSLGVVFGDIGTSPIYTLGALLSHIPATKESIFGFVSLITWTLILLVFVQYAWLAMSLGKKGEGGTIVLKEILQPLLQSPKHIAIVSFLAFIGISLFIGDGVITPAVSILSAVEGLTFISMFKTLSQTTLMFFASIITIILFVFQKRGTEKVASAFGPIMLIWFLTLGISGFYSMIQAPGILQALNPWYAITFIFEHGFMSFFILSAVILCATGGEALYADMGHLGRQPILRAWYFVFVMLILNYLGQGAFLLQNPTISDKILQQMILSQSSFLYSPFVMLSLMATVIASQALISGVFSIVYQGITTGIIPRLKVDYTSSKLRTQVYVGSINTMLLLAILFMILTFGASSNLTDAYGLAVTGDMTITGTLMAWIFFRRNWKSKMGIAVALTIINFTFFCSCLCKIPNGAYWSLIIALFPLAMILIYTRGQKRLQEAMSPVPLEHFVEQYIPFQEDAPRLKGAALFFIRDIKMIHSYVVKTILENNILYEDNILISVVTRDDPFGVIGFFKGSLAPGIRIFEIHRGYMEVLDIDRILKNASISAQVIFYGIEEITTKNIVWKFYSAIKRLVPTFVQFYKLPPDKVHGVITMVTM